LKRILFVCSGNTCRSPLAEALAQKAFARAGLQVEVGSAGVSAMEGMPASDNSVGVARRHHLDLSGHRAHLLSGEMVRRADLIVAMAKRHLETVGVIDPGALAYTRLLTDFCDDIEGDIADPIGGDQATYERTYLTIAKCVEGMAERLDTFHGWRRQGA
jgi:protein-tyrosine-phosphatase